MKQILIYKYISTNFIFNKEDIKYLFDTFGIRFILCLNDKEDINDIINKESDINLFDIKLGIIFEVNNEYNITKYINSISNIFIIIYNYIFVKYNIKIFEKLDISTHFIRCKYINTHFDNLQNYNNLFFSGSNYFDLLISNGYLISQYSDIALLFNNLNNFFITNNGINIECKYLENTFTKELNCKSDELDTKFNLEYFIWKYYNNTIKNEL